MTETNFSSVRMVIRVVLGISIFVASLFWPAGTFNWPEAWIFLFIYFSSVILGIRWLKKNNPGLLEERMTARKKKNVKGWDRVIVHIFTLLFLGIFIIPGLDAIRFGWSHVSLPLKVVGFLGFISSGIWIAWTFKENSYLSEMVRIQDDRGHEVCTTGPYKYMRHPMYVGLILFLFCLPLALGSLYALIPASLSVLLLIIRTSKEDKTLHEELEGYREYAEQVHYKLIPGLW
ncbi:MAG: isoprenylcysteine carboxylmethyltransferase family protein [bacterium]|nr:isoprenylcysteine carboxylmethyltransferase family protein [bacterium]